MNRRKFITLITLGLPVASFGKMSLFDIEVERPKIRKEKVNIDLASKNTINEDKVLDAFLNEKPKANSFIDSFKKNNYAHLMKEENVDYVPLPSLPRKEKNYGYMAKRSKLTQRGTRRLKLYNPHTKEHFNKIYYSKGKYNKKALSDLDYFVRDFREKKIKKIDINLVNLTYSIQQAIHPDKPLTLLSGYRTTKTNNMLRRKSKLVAKNSFHTKGAAFDIAPYDGSKNKLKKIKNLATNMKVGGVGYYKRNGFVHIDTGNIRYWG